MISTQERNFISLFFVNQLSSTNSNKIMLTYTSWRYGTLCEFPFNCSLFIIIHPRCFTPSHYLPYTPPSSHPLLCTQIEVISFPHLSFLFPSPQTKYLLPCFLFNTAFVRSLYPTTSFSAFKYFS